MLIGVVVLAVTSVLVLRRLQGHWLAPGPAAALYWGMAVVVPLVFLGTAYVNSAALLMIGGLVAAFCVGTLFGSPPKYQRERAVQQNLRANSRAVALVAVSGFTAGAVAAMESVRLGGFHAVELLSLQGLLAVGHRTSVVRYEQGTVGTLAPICLALVYAAALVSPYALVGKRRASAALTSLGPTMGALLYSAVSTARLPLLVTAALTAGSYLGMRVLRDGRYPTLRPRVLLGGAAAASALAGLFAAIAFVRVGRVDTSVLSILVGKLEIYAFGYLPAFSTWLHRSEVDALPRGFGTASIAGIGLLIGKERADTRAYDEFVIVSGDGDRTNVYTIFRGLLIDFGLPGSILVLVLLGFVMSRLVDRARSAQSVASASSLGCGYAVLLLSQTMSIASFTNVLLAMVIGVLTTTRVVSPVRHNTVLGSAATLPPITSTGSAR